ncbi:hypothetical protein [Celeribacter persicus]|uniref:Uncharacterized protein n=1 Tax=Celeribacter persicus TaxID=1651082 RepID=A0A2T5HWU2_9RHOB|nr:hypothetical protein [Celeribacter persicus]PTQ76063.1 hypothetical protein C8N42_101609 [Celeribacter persicus]
MTDEIKPPVGKLESFLGIPASELAYAANAVSVIGGAASVVGFFATRSENRKILGRLSEIQDYLKEMDEKLNHISSQNEEILDRLDRLPAEIRQIVDEVVGTHFLEEKYSELISIQNTYFSLNRFERRRFRINATGWETYSAGLTYLMLNEYRLSKIIPLLKWCEFALIITEGRATKVIRDLVFGKSGVMLPLFLDVRDNMRKAHNDLLTALQSKYITSHNFSDQLIDLDKLSYVLASDLPESGRRHVMDCPPGFIINGRCREFVVTYTIRENVKFNEEKRNFPNEIARLKAALVERRDQYAAVRDSILSLLSYFEMVGDDAVELSSIHLTTNLANPEDVPEGEARFLLLADEFQASPE